MFFLVRYAPSDRLTSGLSTSFIPHPFMYTLDSSLPKLRVDVVFTYCLSDYHNTRIPSDSTGGSASLLLLH